MEDAVLKADVGTCVFVTSPSLSPPPSPSTPLLQLMRDAPPPDAPTKPTVFRASVKNELLPVLPVTFPYLQPIADAVDDITDALRSTHVVRTSGVGGALRRRPKWRRSAVRTARAGVQACRNVRRSVPVLCTTTETSIWADANAEWMKGCPYASDQ